MNAPCLLCHATPPDDVIFANAALRVVWVHEPAYPCYVRVIWNAHLAEMTDLPTSQRNMLMAAVFAVEAAMRSVLHPSKINIASFGNRVPHLHWHIIPRWEDDAHWPEPTWAVPQQVGVPHGADKKGLLAMAILRALK